MSGVPREKIREIGKTVRLVSVTIASVMATLAIIAIVVTHLRTDDLYGFDLQKVPIVPPIERSEDGPRIPLSLGEVPMSAQKCLNLDHQVDVFGSGPHWRSIEPRGFALEGPQGEGTREPGCVDILFRNDIKSPVAAYVRRHCEVTFRLSGEERQLRGFWPVPVRWRSENFVIYDDTKGSACRQQ